MRRRHSQRKSGRRRLAAVAAAGTVALTAAGVSLVACGVGRERPGTPPALAPEEAPTQTRRPDTIRIAPVDGARQVRPERGVTVTTDRGTLGTVVVRAKGTRTAEPGRLSRDRRTWRTRWALRPGTLYTVTTTGTDDAGEPTTAVSRFRTLRPDATFAISDVTPRSGEQVGVGMPLIVTFDRTISDRAAVERSLELRMSKRVTGAWNWVSERQVVFRPRRYWPAGQRVTLVAHTTGVRAAPGVYGAPSATGGPYTSGFHVGAARISTVDVRRHRMSVRVNGVVVRKAGISAGKGGRRAYTTTSGVHLAMGKGDPVIMTSGWMGVTDPKDPRYYKLKVRHAVQISSSGEYVHSAPWSISSQGRENVSHGCVNAPPPFARWFYTQSLRGDVITVTGTDRPLEWTNGWGFWQLPWSRWVAGSALERPAPVQRAG
ncbi:L,D-transpeptidase [Actinomadura rudentiformis]|uniref:L,D-transpeptidase n=1 Tax=Actinomadura rudentiformis TaxID=359158 RepID=A0A6H9YP21_9ACTN|nr:Ig-like domain-containing protein [Actinomadura rudentiformis]KAB2349423.1 L,D-transpeptidase [Actinomadura rudentiformis]